MGQKYSTEVNQFRKQSKKEAKRLGFLPNKRADIHPLNKPPLQTKDPRSEKQSKQWELDAKYKLPLEMLELRDKLSLVIDIMEARRIGMYEVFKPYSNYVVFKFEVVDDRGEVENENFTQYKAVFEDRGWNYDRWIDTFRMVSFDLWTEWTDLGEDKGIIKFNSGHYYRIAVKYGTLSEGIRLLRSEQRYKDLYETYKNSKPIYFTIQSKDIIRKNFMKLNPTWYQWRNTNVFIKLNAQIISTRRIPNFDNFLPYTQWPPMILHTGKTRLELMMEEEESGDEEVFKESFQNVG